MKRNATRLLSILLIFVMVLALSACGSDTQNTVSTPPTDAQTAEPTSVPTFTPTPEPEETSEPEPEPIAVPLGGSIDNDLFCMTFDSMEIFPEYSFRTGEHSTMRVNVEEGYQLVIVKGHFENKSTDVISDSSFALSALVNNVFKRDGSDVRMYFIRQNTYKIDPYTDIDYILSINIPQKLADQFETATFTIGFKDDLSFPKTVTYSDGTKTIEIDQQYSFTYGYDDAETAADEPGVADQSTPIAFGDTITTPRYDFTLNYIELTYELKPANTNSVYTSYPADVGKVYIHVDGTITNTSKQDLCIRDLCSPKADYNDGYTYTGFPIVDKDDNSFTWASSYVVATPLSSCHYHGLIECPAEIENSETPLFVTLALPDGVTYRYDIR